MTITLKDRTEIEATPEQAEKVVEAINSGVAMIQLGEAYFRADQVAKIMPSQTVKVSSPKLPEDRATGKYNAVSLKEMANRYKQR